MAVGAQCGLKTNPGKVGGPSQGVGLRNLSPKGIRVKQEAKVKRGI